MDKTKNLFTIYNTVLIIVYLVRNIFIIKLINIFLYNLFVFLISHYRLNE